MMKGISTYINEKLKFGNGFQLPKHEFSPSNYFELRDTINKVIERDGNDADLNIICTSDVNDMCGLFNEVNHKVEVGDIDVSEWDVSRCMDMSGMFMRCSKFNSDISRWNVSNVKTMGSMFYGCKEFNQDLSKWDVSNVTDMSLMFHGCSNFNQDLSQWDVSNVEFIWKMFFSCKKFNQNLDSWKLRNGVSLNNMFYGCTSMEKLPDWYE